MSTRDEWQRDDTALFEYHCWESDESADADLWHRSRRPVTVVGHIGPEHHDPCLRVELPTLAARGAEGTPCLYHVRFADGHVADVFEDELLDEQEGKVG